MSNFYTNWYINMKRGRGRPRKYDPEAALESATRVFWQEGYDGTKVDDIAAATGMSKPSLYAAFGEKPAIFKACLRRYNEQLYKEMQNALDGGRGLRQDLLAFYMAAVERYNTDNLWMGCFTFSTTQTSRFSSEIKLALKTIEAMLKRRMLRALDEGEIQPGQDVDTLVHLTSSILLGLSVRVKSRQKEKISAAAIHKCLSTVFDD